MSKHQLPRPLELLAPARNIEVGREAILHGADAVYIGATSHGARSAAGNSIEEIAELVEFAHQFRAKVYVTVNTIIYDAELSIVEKLIANLYRIGVDAIIVQDMAVLELDIPPIQLHASTQCDITSLEKARFLQDVGFSQLVLARELSISEIKTICEGVRVPIECFVHGALCVSYSGRCHASFACNKRSANRGECSQMCRLPYTLTDAEGKVLSKDKYLLSMHDFNTLQSLDKMVSAGVSSFKIEGRLKDKEYVKNITALYRKELDRIIAANPQKYCRSSFGRSYILFTPDAAKSFNRGFTDFCLNTVKNNNLVSLLTPKSLGERVTADQLNNGDGVSWIENGKYVGARVNKVNDGKIVTADHSKIPAKAHLHRTYDIKWEQELGRETATRKIDVNITLNPTNLLISDERGVTAYIPVTFEHQEARTSQNRKTQFEKLGNTIYRLASFEDNIPSDIFIPNSYLASLRRNALNSLERAARASYSFRYRDKELPGTIFPVSSLDYKANAANRLAIDFYHRHGVQHIEPAIEVSESTGNNKVVMTSRHCILRQLNMCLREGKSNLSLPLTITSGNNRFRIETDCDRCEMKLVKLPANKLSK